MYAVIQNVAHEGEVEVKRSRNFVYCVNWIKARYTEEEQNDLHVDIALVRDDGTLTYDF